MIVDVTTTHMAEVRRKGRRPKDERFLLRVAVEIPEATPEEAPVVLWWRPPHHGDAWASSGVQTVVRHYGGRFYAPLIGRMARDNGEAEGRVLASCMRSVGDEEPLPPVLSAAGFARALAERVAFNPGRDETAPDKTLDEDGAVTGVESSCRAAVEGNLRRSCASYLIVEGVAHVPVGMPVLEVDDQPQPHIKTAYAEGGFLRPDRCYCLPRHADAVTTLESAAQSRRKAAVRSPDPDVLRPDLLFFDDREWMLRATARAVLAYYSRSPADGPSPVADFPRGLLVAYAALRDAHAGGAEPTAADAADLLEAFTDAWRGTDTWRVESARSAVERYRTETTDEPDEDAILSGLRL
jgi:hypothetical protein